MQRAPTEFMCLMLKLLQLQPEKEIIVEFIKNEDYKYVRVLGEDVPAAALWSWIAHLSHFKAPLYSKRLLETVEVTDVA